MNKSIFKLVLSLILVTSLSAVGQTLSRSPQGGVATGGGNTLGSPTVSPDEIKSLIMNSKIPALYTLRSLEYMSKMTIWNSGSESENALSTSLFAKLFLNKKNIYQVLATAQFHVLDQGSCYDKNGVEVEGSAISAPTLCFSLEKIAKRVNIDSAQPEVLGLVLHEVSHMVETTEEEATRLQLLVRASVAKNIYHRLPDLLSQYREQLEDAQDSIQYIQKAVLHAGEGEICGGIASTMHLTNELLKSNTKEASNAVIFSSSEEMYSLIGLAIKSANLSSFCQQIPGVERAFGNGSEVSLSDFVERVYGKNQRMAVPKWTIRKIGKGDRKNLQLELNDMSKRLKSVIQKL